MRILFMGTPDFAVPSLESLVAAGHTVCGVFTQPDKPRNRGMKLQAPPVKVCALAHNIPVYQPVKLRDGAALALIQELAPELIVVAAYGRILPDEILAAPPKGCINVHSSLLPNYRGAAPIHWAVLNGERETGVTIMHMAHDLDAGDIIAQAATPIDPDETVVALHDRLAVLGAELLVNVVADWAMMSPASRSWWPPTAAFCRMRSWPHPQRGASTSTRPCCPTTGGRPPSTGRCSTGSARPA